MHLRRCVVSAVVAGVAAVTHSAAGAPLLAAVAAPAMPAEPGAGPAGALAPGVAVPNADVPSTPTTVLAPPSTITTAPAPRRATTTTAADRMAQVMAILDSAGWDWRRAGITVRLGDHPHDPGHWGIYDARAREVWVGRGAFAGPARLRYVVLHEAAHGWQYTSGRISTLYADLAVFGHPGGGPALEAGADCVARLWGATAQHYWNCPPAARTVMARRLAGDWS